MRATIARAGSESARATGADPGPDTAADPPAGPAAQLADSYRRCEVRPGRVPVIDRYHVAPIVAARATYEGVGARLGIPWWFVGVIHGLESAFSFDTHLHNGDPLTARTVRHPPGRPATGRPPFSWLESAVDALTMQGLAGLRGWTIGHTLDRLERYNGLGYRQRGLPSPYLWSFSDHYEKGKFVADGRFDPEAVSNQCGGAVLIKRMEERGLIDTADPLGRAPGGSDRRGDAPAIPGVPAFVSATAEAELTFPGALARGRRDTGGARDVHRVQEWCAFHGIPTAIDGIFGPGTEDSVRAFQTRQGLEPTGVVDVRAWAALTTPMREALAPVTVGGDDTFYDVVLRVAERHLAVRPVEFNVRGDGNRGPWVRLYMLGEEGAGQPWCAGFVSHVVAQAALAMGCEAPMRRQVGVDALVADAKTDGRFVAGAGLTRADRVERLRPGCLFVVRKSARDWTHVGFVTEVGADRFATIEGNTNDEGHREGVEVCARTRGYAARDFVMLL